MKKSLKQWLLAASVIAASCACQPQKNDHDSEKKETKACHGGGTCTGTLNTEKTSPGSTTDAQKPSEREPSTVLQQVVEKKTESKAPSLAKEKTASAPVSSSVLSDTTAKSAVQPGSASEVKAETPVKTVSSDH